jgi:predicted helicase
MSNDKAWCEELIQIVYRPFDTRWTVFNRNVAVHRRERVMRHMLSGNNLGLVTTRQTKDTWHALVSNTIVGHKSLAAYDINFLFPLYLYPTTEAEKATGIKKCSNFSPEFLSKLESLLGYTPAPESIFYYIYAILNSPTYRDRYAEFLKIDFPRIPLTSNHELFRQLADYGEQLVQLHLMTSPKLDNPITEFVEETGERTVAPGHPKYQNGAVYINKNGDKFTGVPEEVWNFYVGSYQPCQKWLKDRKGRTLNDEDILHYQKIVVALKETIELMTKIDEAIPGFPIQ